MQNKINKCRINCRIKVTTLILILLFNITQCNTFQDETTSVSKNYVETPDVIVGCSKYRGTKRLNCVKSMIKRLEVMENSTHRDKIIKSTRDGAYVIEKHEACLLKKEDMSKLKCWTYTTEPIYKPTVIQKVLESMGIGIVAIFGGFVIGKQSLIPFVIFLL